MGKSTKEIIEQLSNILYMNSTCYKFPKGDKLPNRYLKGRISIYDWVNEVCFYFIQQDNQLYNDFKQALEEKRKELENLEDSPYKSGIMTSFKEIENIINDINTKKDN